MKIIHTSDWHVGVDLYGHDRSEEHASFFAQLSELMRRECPDVLVVSGDIYDRVLPSQASQRLYMSAMLRLHEASPSTEIVVTAGNHDSASRLEIYRPLWSSLRVHIIGTIERNGEDVNHDKHIIYIPDRGYVVAVPFVYPHNYPPATSGGADRQRAFIDTLISLVEKRNTLGLPIVLMAHTAVAGSDFVGHSRQTVELGQEERTTVGNVEVVTFDELGSGYDYLALGHIHRPQEIRGSGGRAFYAGSPFAMSFDEVFPHSVMIVDVAHDQPPVVRREPIRMVRKLRTVPSEPMPMAEVLEQIETEIDVDEKIYLRVNLSVDGAVPIGVEEKIVDALRRKPHTILCTIKYTNTYTGQRTEVDQIEMYESVRANDPMQIARQYMRSKGLPEEVADEYETMISDVWSNLREEDRV